MRDFLDYLKPVCVGVLLVVPVGYAIHGEIVSPLIGAFLALVCMVVAYLIA